MQKLRFILNGKPTALEVDGDRTLLWVLRTEMGLTGTKYGCGEGLCGACTVLIDGDAQLSCQTSVGAAAGSRIITIEGLATGEKLHPVQQAFIDHDALQCGFCTPGMILKAVSLLGEYPAPTRTEIIDSMDDYLCRCGAHKRIIAAIQDAAKRIQGGATT